MTRIGLVVHNIHDDFSIELIKGAELFCEENSCQLFILPVNSKNSGVYGYEYRYQANMELINHNNLDGIIVSGGTVSAFINPTEYKKILNSKKSLPIVNITTDIKGYPFVISDSEKAFKKLIQHLISEHKCKNFILVKANDINVDSVERETWFKEVLKANNIDFDSSNVIQGDFNKYTAARNLEEYINFNGLNADAIVCLNDTMAVGVIDILNRKNINVPNDVIVTGFDDKEESRYITPPLTTVNTNIQLQGYNAAKILLKKIKGKKVSHKKVIDGVEKIRCSCGCLDINDVKIESINSKGKKIKYNKKQLSYIMRKIPQATISQLNSIHYFLADTREVATFKDFLNNLPKHLLRASIDAISICVYDEPLIHKKTDEFFMPNKARRIFKYEKIYKDSLNYDEVYFNPHEQLIPKNTFFKNYPKLVVIPLFEKEFQYGYFVASIESDNYLFYEILCEFFAKEITNALKIDDFYMKNKELQTTAEHLSYLSQTDELTQIMNRRGFVKNVSQIFNEKKSGMIIYCDMDGLKKINDTFGHDGGDKAIIAQSKILLNSCSDTDIVARFAGDEFVVASLNMTQKGFEKFKKSVAKQCEFFNSSSGFDYKISISLGAAAFGPGNYDLPIILAQADIELYKDKRSKKKEK